MPEEEFPPPGPEDLVTDEQIAEVVRALIKAPESVPVKIGNPDKPHEPGKWLAFAPEMTATGSWYVDGRDAATGQPNIDVILELYTEFAGPDAPSDDDVVNVQDRMEDVARQWDGIKNFIYQSLEHGDPSFMMEARDLIPGLIGNTGLLLAAMNRAIEGAEGDHT